MFSKNRKKIINRQPDSSHQNKKIKRGLDDQENSPLRKVTTSTNLPNEIIFQISKDGLSSWKDKLNLGLACRDFYSLFQKNVNIKAKEAAEYVIYPTKENIANLKLLLESCPALLLHSVKVENRHGMAIKGTVYQIALHEGDDELIEDVIKKVFLELQDGEKIMEAQRQAWLPEGWMNAEKKACVAAFEAIDHVCTAFKEASNPDDITESPDKPYTITINHQGVKVALEAFRKNIDVLYEPTTTVIMSGRDLSMCLLERVINRYQEYYNQLGMFYETPRHNALMCAVIGYCQRFGPINFMQAFAQGIFHIIECGEKLKRSFEHSIWPGHFILPLDSNLLDRLGYEYFIGSSGGRIYGGGGNMWRGIYTKLLINQKELRLYNPELCNTSFTMNISNF